MPGGLPLGYFLRNQTKLNTPFQYGRFTAQKKERRKLLSR
jgi:hypothetical protein